MICPSCGAMIPDGSGFCSACGTRIYNIQQPVNNGYNNNGYNNGYNNNGYNNGYNNNGYNNRNYGQPPYNPYRKPQKSRTTAGLLAIFLGGFGIYNFYLGFTTKALIQLLVTVLSCGIAGVAMGIWALIEGIFYLTGHEGYTTDSDGVPLKD
jgi:TM2 domain-containing membrane protein YozV